ncbi:MAG: helix-turn-helix domain-containing protein [Candidatus Doudnabacteria bacterium]|nr:helix-turn-helix domain-containing protein [Candidatus Doudnabacteria bacterium]
MGMEGQTLIAITPEYMERMVTNLRQEIADGFVHLKTHMVEKPIDRTGAAEYLTISLSTLDDRISKGTIPANLVHKNGGTPYFFASELEQLLKKS